MDLSLNVLSGQIGDWWMQKILIFCVWRPQVDKYNHNGGLYLQEGVLIKQSIFL